MQLNETMSHAMQDYPRWMGHSVEFWQNGFTGEGNWKSLQYSFLKNPMNTMKRQVMTVEDELPWLVGVQYATEKAG